MRYHYFISYQYRILNSHNYAPASSNWGVDIEIKDIDMIRTFENMVQTENNWESVIVNSFQLLRAEEEIKDHSKFLMSAN